MTDRSTRVALVPGVLALLPEYAGIEDPVAELRAACLSAVGWLGGDVTVLADDQGKRVAGYLLEAAGVSTDAGSSSSAGLGGFDTVVAGAPPGSTTEIDTVVAGAPPGSTTGGGGAGAYLVVGNGSATRTEKAPGHFDERAEGFDAALGESLRAGRPAVDAGLARELWASVEGIVQLATLGDLGSAQVDYDDAPYGVQYWVMRWVSSGSPTNRSAPREAPHRKDSVG